MSDPFMTTYKQYLPAVTRFAHRIAKGDRDLADDLMQEGWVALLDLPKHRWSQEPYVHTVLCRAMRRWLRREQGRAIVQMEMRQPQRHPRQREVDAVHLHPDGSQSEVCVVHSQPGECQPEVRAVHLQLDERQPEVRAAYLQSDERQPEVRLLHLPPDEHPPEVDVLHLHPDERQPEVEAVQLQQGLAA